MILIGQIKFVGIRFIIPLIFSQPNQKMYSALLALIYLLYRTQSSSLNNCLYTQQAQLFSGSSSSNGYQAQGYLFSLTWNNSKILSDSYSFALNSFSIQADILLSYKADLLNVTTSGGTFYFNPSSFSQIYRVAFTIILKLNCSQYFSVLVYNLSPHISVGNLQTIILGLGFVISNTSDYATAAFISSYELQANHAIHEIMAEIQNLIVNTDYFSTKIYSNIVLTQFKVTYIINRVSTSTFKPIYYRKVYASDSTSSYGIPIEVSSIFSALGYSKCAIGISYYNKLISPYPSYGSVVMQISESASTISYIITLTNSRTLYSILCQAVCALNTYPDYSISTTACYVCPANCTACIDQSRCGSCSNSTLFLNDNLECSYCKEYIFNCSLCTSKYNCEFCDEGFYADEAANYTCSPCSKIDANCISCNGSRNNSVCLGCEDGYYIDSSKNYTCDSCPGACKTCLSRSYCLSCRSSSYSFALNSTNTICVACLPECESCEDLATCTECKRGLPTKGGCTEVAPCLQVNTSLPYTINRCIACLFPNQAQADGSCNGCLNGYFLAGEVCTNIIGCKTAAKVGTIVTCVVCFFDKNFKLLPVLSICQCKEGYHIVNNTCKQICGDGKRIVDKCDDGNRIKGDGCSQICQIQEGFYCDPKKVILNSRCIYIEQNVELILVNIHKVTSQNKAKLTFRFRPYLSMDRFLNPRKDVLFSTASNILIEQKIVSADTLTITLDYFEDIQDQTAVISVMLDPVYFLQTSVTLSFIMKKDGLLIYQQNISTTKTFSDIFVYLSIVSLVILCLSLWFHKLVGIQFMYPLQFIYLSQLINTYPTLLFSLLNFLASTTFNFNYDSNGNTHFDTNNDLNSYNSYNEQFCIIAVTPLLVLSFFLSLLGFFLVSVNNYFKLVKILKFIYNRIYFTLSTSFFPIFCIILMTKKRENSVSKITHLLESVSSGILSLGYFYEWKRALCQPINGQIIEGIGCRPRYIPGLLSLLALNSAALVLNYTVVKFEFQIYMLAFSGFFLIAAIFLRPYESNLHNMGVVFTLSPLIYYLTWCILRNRMQIFRKEEKQLIALFILIGLIALSMLITLIRLIYQFKMNFKNSGEKRKNDRFKPQNNMKPIASPKEAELETRKVIYGQNQNIEYFQLKKKQNQQYVPSHFFQNIKKKAAPRSNQRDLKKELLQRIKKGKKKMAESSNST